MQLHRTDRCPVWDGLRGPNFPHKFDAAFTKLLWSVLNCIAVACSTHWDSCMYGFSSCEWIVSITVSCLDHDKAVSSLCVRDVVFVLVLMCCNKCLLVVSLKLLEAVCISMWCTCPVLLLPSRLCFCHTGTLMLSLDLRLLPTVYNSVEWFFRWDWSLSQWPTVFLQCFGTVAWVIWPVKTIPEMTRNISSWTLNLY